MDLPKGVTIHTESPDRPAEAAPRNVLELAARQDDRAAAVILIRAVLAIQGDRLADFHIDDAKRWRRLPEPERLRQIGEWIRAEAYELMDFVERPSPMDVVGTND